MRRIDFLKEKLDFLKKNDPRNYEIEELEKSIEKSKRGRSSKVKGASYERKIAKLFSNIFNAEFGRTPSSGGYKKEVANENLRGDIVCLDKDFLLHLELKNHKNGWNTVKEWYKQAEGDCIKGKIPCVVFHQLEEKQKYNSKDFIMLELNNFFKIVDKNKLWR